MEVGKLVKRQKRDEGMWAGRSRVLGSRCEVGQSALCSLFLHLLCLSGSQSSLLCSGSPTKQLVVFFRFFSVACFLEKMDLQVWEGWGWPVWHSVLYHLCCSPFLLLCFTSIQHFCKPFFGSSGWTPRNRGFWLGTVAGLRSIKWSWWNQSQQ